MQRREKIQLVSVILLFGFCASLGFHFFLGNYLHKPYPCNTFLFDPRDVFMDYFNLCDCCRHRNPYFDPTAPYPFAYFPLAGVMYYGFSKLSAAWGYGLYSIAYIVPLIGITARHVRIGDRCEDAKNILIFSLLTYPLLFTFDRGNCEGLLVVCVAGALLLCESRPMLQAALLAVAIAMKLYPAVFLILLVSERKFQRTAMIVVFAALLVVVPLLCLRGGFAKNAQFIMGGFGVYQRTPTFELNHREQTCIGLFQPLKMIVLAINDWIAPVGCWRGIRHCYEASTLAAFGLLSLYVFFVEKERWKRTALLTFAALLFPEVSCPYKLLWLLLPLFLFFNAEKAEKTDRFYAWIFGLLLIPNRYWFFPGWLSENGHYDCAVSTLIDPLLMVTMAALIIWEGFHKRKRTPADCHSNEAAVA